MELEIQPLWDRSETVTLRLCEQRRELVVSANGEVVQYLLRQQRPGGLGWVERRLENGLVRRRRVSVAVVVVACLREWEAEERVIALSDTAARCATGRTGAWRTAGERLGDQVKTARARKRVSTLPFQVLWRQRSEQSREQSLSARLAAERVGFLDGQGRGDTQRLMRRFGLAEQSGHGGQRRQRRQRTVGYRTGLALCRAVDVDPVELGL